MGHEEAAGKCRRCRSRVMVRRETFELAKHGILSVITGGIWVPFAAVASLKPKPWRCTICGARARRLFFG